MNLPARLQIDEENALTEFSELAEKTRSYILDSLAPATRRAYASDYKIFAAWCETHNIPALPVTAETLAMFLASQANDGIGSSTLNRRCAAIRYAHHLAGHDSPTKTKVVSATMKGIRRRHGKTINRKSPSTAQRITIMIQHCPDSLIGLRDRALLLLGFSGAFRRSELVALKVRDLEFTPEGIKVLVRHSKTDQASEGAIVPILNGTKLKPVESLLSWLEAAQIQEGPLFRPITKGGTIQPFALSDKSVANIVKVYALKAGFDREMFSGHSLRSGFLTSAAESGASLFKMIEVSRHKNLNMLQVYVRMAELFKDHAGNSFL